MCPSSSQSLLCGHVSRDGDADSKKKPRVESLSKARHGQGLLRANFGRVCNFPGIHRDFVTNMFYSLGSLIRKFRSRGSLFKNDGPSFFKAI